MHEFLAQIIGQAATPAQFSLDTLPTIFASVAGVALAVIHIYNTTRNKAFDIQVEAIEHRLAECEHGRDVERAKHDATRNALTDAMGRISQLIAENKELRDKHAGPESR